MTAMARTEKRSGMWAGLTLTAAALGAWALFAAVPGPASAQEVVLFNKKPPTAGELADILFPPEKKKVLYRGISRVKRPSAAEETRKYVRQVGLMVNFALNSAEILPDSRPVLDEVGKMLGLQKLAGARLIIEGHTDATGGESYNQGLSEMRALSVKRYLVRAHGVESNRLLTIGKGEAEPLNRGVPTDPVNRRVQFRAVK